jgi:hypothetical protein
MEGKEQYQYEWTEFNGLPNTRSVLAQKATALSKVIYENIPKMIEDITCFIPSKAKGVLVIEKLQLEVLIGIIYIINCYNTGIHNALEDVEKEKIFINTFTEELYQSYIKDIARSYNVDQELLQKLYTQRSLVYDKYEYLFYDEHLLASKEHKPSSNIALTQTIGNYLYLAFTWKSTEWDRSFLILSTATPFVFDKYLYLFNIQKLMDSESYI